MVLVLISVTSGFFSSRTALSFLCDYCDFKRFQVFHTSLSALLGILKLNGVSAQVTSGIELIQACSSLAHAGQRLRRAVEGGPGAFASDLNVLECGTTSAMLRMKTHRSSV